MLADLAASSPRLWPAIAVMMVLWCAAPLDAQRGSPAAASLDLIVLDVVVADRKGTPIPDLTAADFQVREDGAAVEVKTFELVDARDGEAPDAGRTVAVLLDDTGVPPLGTTGIQQLAKAVISLARRPDELSVVRLHSRSDEAFGDSIEALSRIDGYRGGVIPFNIVDAQTDALNQVAAISRQLAITEGRRKALVCIGSQQVCDMAAPGNDTRSQVSKAWVAAISAAARANVAVYAIIPGRVRQRGGGLAEATGGLTYASFSDFREPILRLWSDTSTHYLLGYWPGSRSRPLHSIDVSVARPGVRVRARRLRGE